MTQYEWVMTGFKHPDFPEEIFEKLRKMEFESPGFLARLVPIIIERGVANYKELRWLFTGRLENEY